MKLASIDFSPSELLVNDKKADLFLFYLWRIFLFYPFILPLPPTPKLHAPDPLKLHLRDLN